jgi:acetyl esterase/lipase
MSSPEMSNQERQHEEPLKQQKPLLARLTRKARAMLSIFLLLLPRIPLIARVILLHILRISEQAQYLDLRTALTVAVVRSILKPSRPTSISETQRLITRDRGTKGRIWISKYTAPPPEGTSLRDALVKAIENLQHPFSPKTDIRRPDIIPVEAEWTGYRAGVGDNETLPAISEEDRYHELMKEAKSAVTILYFHGGAYWLMDPATHRTVTAKLAKLTGGRCYSVRYRLAPQHPFPAALMDAFVSYLTLLYPPSDAFHEAVSPEQIVFAGDR